MDADDTYLVSSYNTHPVITGRPTASCPYTPLIPSNQPLSRPFFFLLSSTVPVSTLQPRRRALGMLTTVLGSATAAVERCTAIEKELYDSQVGQAGAWCGYRKCIIGVVCRINCFDCVCKCLALRAVLVVLTVGCGVQQRKLKVRAAVCVSPHAGGREEGRGVHVCLPGC